MSARAVSADWCVYLMHFDRPFGHARHYMGVTNDLESRERTHRSGRGANLIKHHMAAGGDFVVARVWTGKTERQAREREREWKRRGKAPLCPLCKAGEREP